MELEERQQSPAAALATFVDRLLLSCLVQPASLEELAGRLELSPAEVRRWCQRLVEQGRAGRLTRPVRYVRDPKEGSAIRTTPTEP